MGGNLRASAHHEDGQTDTHDAGVTGSYGYKTWGGSLSVSGQTQLQDWALGPSLAGTGQDTQTPGLSGRYSVDF